MLPLIAALAPILLPRVTELAQSIHPTAGQLAETVVGTVAAVTGLPIATTADAARAVQAVQADPALALELARRLDENVSRRIEADNLDRANARAREIALAGEGDTTASTLAYGIVGAFVAATLGLIAASVLGTPGLKDPTIAGMVGGALGYLSAKAEQVVSYYFGSSAGSKAKTVELAAKR